MDEKHPGEPWLPLDTTLEAARVQTGVYQRMTPEQRLIVALELSAAARRASLEGVKARHPEYTDRQAELAAIRLRLGDELFKLAYPGEEARP